MDPVDTAISWAKTAQRKVYYAVDDIANSQIVNETSNIINTSTDAIYDFVNHRLLGAPEPANMVPPPPEINIRDSRRLVTFLIGGAVVGGLLYKKYYGKRYDNTITIRNNKRYIKTNKRRRFKRLPNGARVNVVIIMGSPLEPLTRVVANDLEKRGCIVYITAISDREIQEIEAEESEDIRAFRVNSSNEGSLLAQVNAFDNFLNNAVIPFPQAEPHYLKLLGVLIIPDLYYPVGPVENIGIKGWSDCINAKIMSPLLLFSNNFLNLIRHNNAIHFQDKALNSTSTKFMLIAPNLKSSINLPFNSPETTAIVALESIFESLSREVSSDPTLNLQLINIKVGALNIFNTPRRDAERLSNSLTNQILGWSDEAKAAYGSSFKKVCSFSGPTPSVKGSHLRELNYKIFDILTNDINNKDRVKYKRDMKTVFVGSGARSYDLIGKFCPRWLLNWVLGCNSIPNIIYTLLGY